MDTIWYRILDLCVNALLAILAVLPLLTEAMDNALELSVPLLVDGNAAETWYEAH